MEELNGVAKHLEDKSLLVTGSTGFIAKLLVEKVLRVQPKVKKLFLLVRANDQISARKRVQTEIMQLQIFHPLREKYGEKFSSWFWSKIYPVAGDVSLENLGINDSKLREDLWKGVDLIINVAAVTLFRERYDIALAINTFGVKHVIEFASRCAKLDVLLHVSTAYVMAKEAGTILEKPLQLYKSLDGRSNLDISEEMALVHEKLKELTRSKASEDTVKLAMKKLGIERAQKFGWPHTYVFTKAMGEMIAYDHGARLPLVVLRPTGTTSTWKEPFPGWIEGVKGPDTWITGYGKGDLKFIPGDVTTVVDIVPADIVVNAMLAIVGAHRRGSPEFIYQIGSSVRNPFTFGELMLLMYKYFSEKPYIRTDGRAVEVKEPIVPATMASFYADMDRHYKEPLQVVERHGASATGDRDRYNHLKREYNRTVAVAEALRPGAFYKRRFDDSNMQKLMTMIKEEDRELFPFDTKFINWEQYITEIHIPGVLKHETREVTRPRL